MRKLLVLGIIAALLTGTALAQQFGALPLALLTGAERVVVSNGGAQITTITVAQVRDGSGYLVSAPVSGQVVQAATNASLLSLFPAGTLAALTINMPLVPFDGQRMQIFTSQAVTALTITTSVGTVSPLAPVTTLAANQTIEYVYNATTQQYVRCQ